MAAAYYDHLRKAIRNRRAHAKKNGPGLTRARERSVLRRQPIPDGRRTMAYFAAPPSNHAASFTRSSSVMCVTLPIGIAFRRTACS